jgi:hypothetical protein
MATKKVMKKTKKVAKKATSKKKVSRGPRRISTKAKVSKKKQYAVEETAKLPVTEKA